MECREFEKRIPEFMNYEMNYRSLKKFIAHMEGCPVCKEELTIQFLIEKGLIRLEEGSAFDLKTELSMRLEEAAKKIRFHDSFIRGGRILETIMMLGVAAVIAWIIAL